MISKLGQVMLYVNDQDQAKEFWTKKVGFAVIAEEGDGEGMKSFEVAPSKSSETSIVLQSKELVAKMSPELNLGTPSLLFFADNLDELYSRFKSNGVTVGDLVEMPFGRVFNFADDENNYFAILEKK
jgi:lactoylglutathione lyase